jgi:hypothetical protein
MDTLKIKFTCDIYSVADGYFPHISDILAHILCTFQSCYRKLQLALYHDHFHMFTDFQKQLYLLTFRDKLNE